MADYDAAVEAFLAALGANGGHELDVDDILIDWATFWAADHADEEWLAWPIIPAKRQIVIYAPAKAGKSLLTLDVVASIATGRPILGQKNPNGPLDVLYLDYEMTQADLRARLEEMGYGPDDDLSHLHYASLPSLPALNTPEGAKAVVELAKKMGAVLVIVDTFSRAVEGDENDSATINEFYRWTGLALKAAQIALVRIDHAGKDLARGQRGSSAKAGDVDAVWELRRADDGLTLKATHTRVGWITGPHSIAIEMDPVLRHTVGPKLYESGTKECAEALEALGLPVDISSRGAIAALREAGQARRRSVVVSALRYRHEQLGTTSGTTLQALLGTSLGTKNRNGHLQGTESVGNLAEPLSESRGGVGSHVVGTTHPDHADEDF